MSGEVTELRGSIDDLSDRVLNLECGTESLAKQHRLDLFAAAALTGILASRNHAGVIGAAQDAWQIAGAMLATEPKDD